MKENNATAAAADEEVKAILQNVRDVSDAGWICVLL